MPEDEREKIVKSLEALQAMRREIERQLAEARAAEAAAAAARQAQDNKR